MNPLIPLIESVQQCTVCTDLPLGPKPILQAHADARILVAGQAPGRITHQQGIPFDDPSGERLRNWMGIDRERFYTPSSIAILPMGFCFPGGGKGGDLPPKPACAQQWRNKLLAELPNIELILVIGRYAMDWHLDCDSKKHSVTNIVANWREFWPDALPMPHPSPRNNRWLKNNPWFEIEVVPRLQKRIAELL